MARHGIRPAVLAICLPCLLIFGSNGAVGTEPDAGESEVAEGQAWRQQIVELEARLFDPLLPPTEVNRLLGELEHAETRPEAARRLGQQGQGHIDRVIAFARQCPDMEARQACVEIVEALDASYRTAELGKQLGALYRRHANALLPAYWARFRNDPLDPRAVAMLMHAEPDAAYAALGRTGDRHDRLRYLLLRIRELSPDEFARKHVFEHSVPGVLLAMPDVFPVGAHRDGPLIYGRVHRTVGQAHVGVVRLCASRSFDTLPHADPFGDGGEGDKLPAIRNIELGTRWFSLMNHSGRLYHWHVDTFTYGTERIDQRNRYFSSSTLWEGLCPLPTLKSWPGRLLGHIATLPWWMKPYLPATYHEGSRFIERKPGESEPEVAPAGFSVVSAPGDPTATPLPSPLESRESPALLDPAAPAVVILPPQLSGQAGPSAIAAAELACDRLAQKITAAGLARVVDRQQVDRLLRERELASGALRPMLGFDAMIRLEVDTPALVPIARLSLVDLSYGNPLSETEYDWPLREADVPAIVEQYREAFKQVGRPKDGKLKVRCFGVENPDRNPRIAPLAARLGQVFEQAVARSPGLVRVRHLEAASAKEESLLLLLGLSRLPGGRQFVPQADATIELKLCEGDGRDKTFEETPVEIVLVVGRADGSAARSWTIGGTVETFDGAVARAWEQLAEMLREARPAAAADWLSEMAVRRRQAEAELRAARAIQREEPGTHDPRKLLGRLEHAETALKLDPTFEDAVLEHIEALRNVCIYTSDRARFAERQLAHAVRYFEQFGPEAAHRHAVHEACRSAVHLSVGTLDFEGSLELTPQRLRIIHSAQVLLEHSIQHGCHSSAVGYQAMTLVIVGRGMARTGVPLDVRQQWVDSILEQCIQAEDRAAGRNFGDVERLLWEHNALWLRAAELAIEDGSMDRAKRLIGQLQDRLAPVARTPFDQMFHQLYSVVVKMDDGEALAQFHRWLHKLRDDTVRPMEMHWPVVDVFPAEEPTGPLGHTMPSVEGIRVRHESAVRGGYPLPFSALVVGEDRLYVVIGDHSAIGWGHFRGEVRGGPSQVLGYLRLDDAGRPIGKPHRDRHTGSELHDAVTLLPQPQVDGPLHVLDAHFLAGRLYLGTWHDGLLVFNPKRETWSSFGPEQGLPKKGVSAIHLLDEQTLFCIGESDRRRPVCYILELPEGKIRLGHRADGQTLRLAPRLFWRDGPALRAWSWTGLYDDLLAEELMFTRRGSGAPYGWNHPRSELVAYPSGFISSVEVDGRRFVTNAGLHEFDAKGTFLRTWWGNSSYRGDDGRAFNVPLPPDCPIQSMYMVAAGSLLVFISEGSVLAWDPKTDTWHGPLAVTDVAHGTGTQAGVWLAARAGLVFVSTDDLLATAKSVGRALTTDQYRQRQRAVIAALPPVDRAKVAYSMRQFDTAKELTEGVLRDDPQCSQALLLMGNLHDLWGMNRPEVALEYYRRLAEVTADRSAALKGMYRRLVLLRAQGRWAEALATIQDIAVTFPRLNVDLQRDIDRWRNHIQKQLAETDVKPPAAATSNETERAGN